jgi:cytochrome c biogenesis protein CcdA
MGSALLFDLTYAAGVALSPTPIAVVILMLFSARARNNALAYLIGWMIGLFLLAVVLYQLTTIGLDFFATLSSSSRPIADMLLGVILVVLAGVEWRKRPKPGEAAHVPKLLAEMDRLMTKSDDVVTPLRALGLGILMSAISPKNIALMVAAGIAISHANIAATDKVVLLTVFVLISSITIGIPVLYAVIAGEKAQQRLIRSKEWLLENNGRVVSILLVLLGVFLLFKGISGLV